MTKPYQNSRVLQHLVSSLTYSAAWTRRLETKNVHRTNSGMPFTFRHVLSIEGHGADDRPKPSWPPPSSLHTTTAEKLCIDKTSGDYPDFAPKPQGSCVVCFLLISTLVQPCEGQAPLFQVSFRWMLCAFRGSSTHTAPWLSRALCGLVQEFLRILVDRLLTPKRKALLW